MAAVLVSAFAHSTVDGQCIEPPSDMVAWWPGDSSTQDLFAGRDGVLMGSASFAPGMVDDAFDFDGAGWVEVADDPAWTLGSNDFTIDLWVRMDALGARRPFIGHDDAGGQFNKWIFWYDPSGHDKLPGVPALRFHINSPHPTPVPIPHDTVVAPWNPVTGQWYHVAVTRSGTTYRLYRDGALVATDTSPYTIPDPSEALTIGRAEGFFLDGLVDEVELHDRALEPEEIQAIFAAGSAGKCKPVVQVPAVSREGLLVLALAFLGMLSWLGTRRSRVPPAQEPG